MIDPDRLRELEQRLELDDQQRRQLRDELDYLRFRMAKGVPLDRALQDWRTELDARKRKLARRDAWKARKAGTK
jgi:hypothetical protein